MLIGAEIAAFYEDLDTNTKFGNARFAFLMGCDPSRLRGGCDAFSLAPSIHPDDQDKIISQTLRAFKMGGGVLSESYRLITPTGEERVILAQGMRFERDGRAFFSGTLIDITPDQVAGIRSGVEDLNEIADLCLSARARASANSQGVITHLLDMTLLEVGRGMAQIAKRKLPDWH